jgi:hypothetical protein
LAEFAAPRAVHEECGGRESRPSPPDPPTTVTTAVERKRKRRTVSSPCYPVVVSRDPRRQAAKRAQPGSCARCTAVGPRDASSRDQRVRGVDAGSGAGAGQGAEERVPALRQGRPNLAGMAGIMTRPAGEKGTGNLQIGPQLSRHVTGHTVSGHHAMAVPSPYATRLTCVVYID